MYTKLSTSWIGASSGPTTARPIASRSIARAIASRTLTSSSLPSPPLTFMVRCVQVRPFVDWIDASERVFAWESTSPFAIESRSISPFAKDCGCVVWSTTEKVIVSSLGARPHHLSLRLMFTTPPVVSTESTVKGPLDGVGVET